MGEIAERGFQKRLGWTQKLMIRIEQAEASLERRNRSSSRTNERKSKIEIPKAMNNTSVNLDIENIPSKFSENPTLGDSQTTPAKHTFIIPKYMVCFNTLICRLQKK